MAISLASLQTSSTLRPPRILMHGVHGVGKTTFAAGADAPVVIMTEDGLGMLKVPHFPLATSYADVVEALDALLNEDHGYSTVVIDSVDWLEPLVWAETCRRNGWASIEAPGFGKGYAEALTVWREYLDRLNALRDRRGMAVVQIAHTDIKRFDSPEHEPYDRYVIKLQTPAPAPVPGVRACPPRWAAMPPGLLPPPRPLAPRRRNRARHRPPRRTGARPAAPARCATSAGSASPARHP